MHDLLIDTALGSFMATDAQDRAAAPTDPGAAFAHWMYHAILTALNEATRLRAELPPPDEGWLHHMDFHAAPDGFLVCWHGEPLLEGQYTFAGEATLSIDILVPDELDGLDEHDDAD